MALCSDGEIIVKSRSQNNLKKLNDDENELPGDFEPGCSRETVLLSTSSYEEEEEGSNSSDYECYKRKGSCIKEIEKDVSKLVIGDSTNEEVDEIEEDKLSDQTDAPEQEVVNVPEEVQQFVNDETEDAESEMSNPVWKHKKKHIFVLSEAGKPIYTRHGNEEKLVTLMGVIQALLSFVQNSGDNIRSIHAGEHNFVFLHRVPLILVAVSMTKASVPQLVSQLIYVYNQIVSVLTLSSMNHVFEQRKNYDLRRFLGGSEKFLDSLIDMMDVDPSFLLCAVRCLSLAASVREAIGQTLVQQCSKVKNIVFAIILANNQLITLVRMKNYFLHPADLHLIMNLIRSSESFKSVESWIPICLPKFDPRGFLHGHISYLDDDNSTCLLLLTVNRDLFFPLKECRTKIIEKLKKNKALEAISKSIQNQGYLISDVGVTEARHFLYKSRSTAQITCPLLGPPYLQAKGWDHLFGLYQYLHHRMHRSTVPLKMLYFSGEKETMVGWHMQGFELYAAFEPLVTKVDATNAMKKIVHWIKKEEENLFIMNAPTI